MQKIVKHPKLLLLVLLCSCVSLMAEEWEIRAPLLTPRANAAAVYLDGYIYVMGGTTTNGFYLNSVERLNLATGAWDNNFVPDFDEERASAASIVFQGKIWLMGGENADEGIMKDVEIYDPQTNQWTEGEELKTERSGHSVFLGNGTICVLGGLKDVGNFAEKMEYFDLVEQEWEDGPDEIADPLWKGFITAIDDSIYIFGGITNFPEANSFKTNFDADWNFSWNDGETLSVPRADGAVAVLEDLICNIGGVGGNNQPSALVEIYDPTKGELKLGTSLPSARRGISAVVPNDTAIYVIGGFEDNLNQPLNVVHSFPGKPTGILSSGPEPTIPLNFELAAAFPNPFNGQINFKVMIDRRQDVQMDIYNLSGQAVAEIHRGQLNPGEYYFHWYPGNSARPVSSGIYFAVLQGSRTKQVIKVSYVK